MAWSRRSLGDLDVSADGLQRLLDLGGVLLVDARLDDLGQLLDQLLRLWGKGAGGGKRKMRLAGGVTDEKGQTGTWRKKRRVCPSDPHLGELEVGQEVADLLDDLDLGLFVKLGQLDVKLRLLLRRRLGGLEGGRGRRRGRLRK